MHASYFLILPPGIILTFSQLFGDLMWIASVQGCVCVCVWGGCWQEDGSMSPQYPKYLTRRNMMLMDSSSSQWDLLGVFLMFFFNTLVFLH